METKDHLLLAEIITESSASRINAANKKAFAAGCIEPDVNLLTYLKGHTYEATIDYVRYTVRRLFGRMNTPRDFFLMGRAFHYIGDYFTFPHSSNFSGTLREHIDYERRLHFHISENRDMKTRIFEIKNPGRCLGFLENAFEKYLSIPGDVKSDWEFIKTVCVSAGCAAMSREARKSRSRIPLGQKKVTAP
ncbi:MAG: zinc dependent phospholipase C family protein [Porcipelethomonas sp.]